MTATVPPVPYKPTAPLVPYTFPKNRIVSHWTKSTPEEGIQMIFNAAEVLHSGIGGVKMETHSPSAERPCQWGFTLCLARPLETQTPSSPKAESPQLTNSTSSTLLSLTMDRILHQSLNTGTGVYMEDPAGASRIRSDAYRTLYIYSPKLKRDIYIHHIKHDSWPQCVVFDGSDVAECEQEYHFQIWLAGSSPRQMDAKTNVRLGQCQELLRAMRKDTSTTNVMISIKDARNDSSWSKELNHAKYYKSRDVRLNSCSSNVGNNGGIECKKGEHDQISGVSLEQTPVFQAHKCVLETTAFFSRMLNGSFKESQVDEDGKFRIELSSDMFDAKIMDILLDYLYTREPIVDKIESNTNDERHSPDPTQVPPLRHVISANVGLNLETIITETRRKSFSADSRLRHSHHQYSLSISELTLCHWGALYRAATHLEDKDLQALSLQQIQQHLDPETTLEQALDWGHQHEDVKSVMLEYLIKKRREIFGNEQQSKLRAYLSAEYDEQIETLVEITSQIARQ
ncbi:hypothetical protein BGZ49_002087 [Haplosporangium sp. Z 27]|nr:hypothetical protein BGZ49_002087 [Haplosporangium sp. Z 27]